MSRLFSAAVIAGFVATGASAEVEPGKATFDHYCAECHAAGFGHPGTQQLGWTRGEGSALLEQRTDLTAAYVTQVVRNGLVEMPPIRPTEIDDAKLKTLAAYLSKGK